ncbi:18811_t:CDS:2 [Entrophospora sp. SA101]|nr:10210_t:CDS:2 [Entrophospora sp. SA101]CAJ0765835.1 23417_t:CDS:2 [Entrophospora sp. SA101]CAJ0765847.1 18811_t:CDS:2 [Entrophospora sp. SA101]CAJ0825114.1 5590_t:CDS:2 [Entrophospora sp. SA101]CAJ0912052.1 20983_t:CDS:2 [Entrophospora sp. SA101]
MIKKFKFTNVSPSVFCSFVPKLISKRQFHVTSINKKDDKKDDKQDGKKDDKQDDKQDDFDRVKYEVSPIYREKAGHLLDLKGSKIFTEHRYSTMNFRISPRKLNFLGRQIAKKPLNEAIKQMEFSHKKASKKIMHSLITARHHAQLYKKMNIDNCYIEQAWVGKGYYRKKPNYAARGRMSYMLIKKSHMKYIIKEKKVNLKEEEEGIKRKRKYKGFNYERKKVWMPLIENKPIYNPSKFYNW